MIEIKNKIKFIIIISLIFSTSLIVKGDSIDSIETLLNIEKNIHSKIKFSIALAKNFHRQGKYEQGIKFGNYALILSKKIKSESLIEDSYNIIGDNFFEKANYIDAQKNYLAALKLCENQKDKKGASFSYEKIGNIYTKQSNYTDALNYYFKALNLKIELGDKRGIASLNNIIGNVFRLKNETKEALKRNYIALTIYKQIGDKIGIGSSYIYIGQIFWQLKNYKEALVNYFLSLKIMKEINDENKVATCYSNIASIYSAEGNLKNALKNHFLALEIRQRIGNKLSSAASNIDIGVTYIYLKKYKEAKTYTTDGLIILKQIGYKEWIKTAYYILSDIDFKAGNCESGHNNYLNYIIYKDSIENDLSRKELIKNQIQYEYEKKEAVSKIEQLKKDIISNKEIKQKENQRNYFVIAFFIISIISIIILKNYRQKKRANTIISRQKIQVENAKQILETKQKEIVDSIKYALKIQNAILPPLKNVSQHLTNSFILYKPKDIVAGDFYWMEKINDTILIAACDSTGHGVPGSLVSVVCHNSLNRAVREFNIKQPAEILNKTSEIIVEYFSKSDDEILDGMDISICSIDLNKQTIEWAGANNPIWIFNNETLTEIKADKQGIGYNSNFKRFTNHEIEIQHNSTIYIFTDGYADQFGGIPERKLTKKRFKNLLIEIQKLSMQKQAEELDKFLSDFKNNCEQTDDILVIGIRL